ncbi:297_t:CDS:2, partial [Diversispora eburnea]
MQIWTSQVVAAGLPISDGILKEKGLEFARILNIEDKLKYANGEANSAPFNTLPKERTKLRMILNEYSYDNIYNADKTGLFFRMEPNQTLILNPHCFKNFNRSALPVIYRTNSKAWMCADIFIEWLNYLDNYFRTMNRKIVLLIDNAGSHFNAKRLEKDNSDIFEDEFDNEQRSKNEESDSDEEEEILPVLVKDVVNDPEKCDFRR